MHRGILVAFLIATCTTTSFAQPKPGYSPSTTHIFPAGARRGTTVEIGVGAECIPPGTEFIVVGKGVSSDTHLTERLKRRNEPSPRRVPTETPITYSREWKSRIKIDANADDIVYWRLSCAQGGTGTRPFVVGDLPEFIERESNSTLKRAEKISLPITVNGQINGERDTDYFRFAAKAGQVVTCEVLAGRIGSRLDPVIEILDTTGRPVRTQDVHIGSDPVVAFRSESDDEYVVRISNVTMHGDPGYVYRINISTKPFVLFSLPASGQPGTQQEVTLAALSGKDDFTTLRRRVTFPKHGNFCPQFNGLVTSSLTLSTHSAPSTVEREPNGTLDAASDVTTPRTIAGQFESKTDEDWFRFNARRDAHYTIVCEKAVKGSAAMPVIFLRDEKGKQLVRKMSVESADGQCRIYWKSPRDGVFHLHVRDMQFGAFGGPDFVYQLSVDEAPPDFELSMPMDAVTVVQEKSATIAVNAVRLGGYSGPIELKLAGLPKGIEVSNNKIAANQNKANVTLKCGADVPSHYWQLKITGTAKITDRVVSRPVTMRHLGVDTEGVSVGPSTTNMFHLTVAHKPVFRLYCPEAYLYAHRGSIFPYPMEVERLDGFDQPINLQIGDRQNRDLDGVEMIPIVVPTGKSDFFLPIYLPETMAINVQSQSQLYSQAYASFVDKHGKKQSVLVLSEKRNMLRTLPPVVKLKAVDEEIRAKPGQTVSCRLFLDRTTNFPGKMKLSLLKPTAEQGFAFEPITIAPGQTQIEAKVKISVQQPGKAELRFRARGNLNKEIVVITEARIPIRITKN